MRKLNKNQLNFCYFRSRGYSQIDSVKKSGYKPHNDNVAGAIGSRLEKDVKIIEEIEKQRVKTFDKTLITEEFILENLREIALNGKNESNRLKGLELLGKTFGLFKDSNVNQVNIITPQDYDTVRLRVLQSKGIKE